MVYNKWNQFRRDNRDLNDVFDADDTAGILMDISADLKRCVSTNHVETIQNIFDAKESKQLFVNDSISFDSLQLRDIQRIVRSNMTSPAELLQVPSSSKSGPDVMFKDLSIL